MCKMRKMNDGYVLGPFVRSMGIQSTTLQNKFVDAFVSNRLLVSCCLCRLPIVGRQLLTPLYGMNKRAQGALSKENLCTWSGFCVASWKRVASLRNWLDLANDFRRSIALTLSTVMQGGPQIIRIIIISFAVDFLLFLHKHSVLSSFYRFNWSIAEIWW